jgi:hypothetical protein
VFADPRGVRVRVCDLFLCTFVITSEIISPMLPGAIVAVATTVALIQPIGPRPALLRAPSPRCCSVPPPPSPPPITQTPPPETQSTKPSQQFDAETPLPLWYWLFGPNPRRAIVPTLLIWGLIAPTTNLWGTGSFLLSLAPEAARSQRLDTFYPVSSERLYPYNKGFLDYDPGFKRFYDERGRFEFRYPARYVQDQAVFLRNADAAYSRRMMDPTLASTPSGRPESKRARGPEVAFGPPEGQRDENLSVVASTLEPGFTMRGVLGGPEEGARRLLERTINQQRVVSGTTLLSASERPSTADGGQPLYTFEYKVDYVDENQPPSYTVCVVGANTRSNQLFTFASRVPAKAWEAGRSDAAREAAASFTLY